MKIFRFLAAASVALASLVAFSSESSARTTSKDLYKQFQNPDSRYRPFVRWWWNGDRVEAEELVRELHILKDAGVGGVEINPISFPYGADAMDTKPLKWLSDEWIDMLKVVFDEAERIGMTCDLIIGSGWPFGAETLPREERASVMLTYAQKVTGGREVRDVQVQYIQEYRSWSDEGEHRPHSGTCVGLSRSGPYQRSQ